MGRLVSALESKCPAAEPRAAWPAGCVWTLGVPSRTGTSRTQPGIQGLESIRARGTREIILHPPYFTCEDEGLCDRIERFLLFEWFFLVGGF